MVHRKSRAIGAKPLLAFLALSAGLAACSEPPSNGFQGYVEGEFVFVASPQPGRLEKLAVARGARVESGARLFVLDGEIEQAAIDAAGAKIRVAEATIANLSTGRRKPELDTLRAQIAAAESALKLARVRLERDTRLAASGHVSQSALDASRASVDRDAAQLDQMQAQLRTGQQSLGRGPEIEAARASLEAARAELAQAMVRLEQKTGSAPAPALVHDTFFREGEWVPAGTPVASLLPPDATKVRFFVPETALSAMKPGLPVSVTCDGCGAPLSMTVSYISPQAEYTPPVIYSRESRAKLVFLIEAKPAPAQAVKLNPGQPVEVKLSAQ